MPRLAIALLIGLLGIGATWLLGGRNAATPSAEPPEATGDARLRRPFELALRARTAALEQLADQCAPEAWLRAETERDAAASARQVGDTETARVRAAAAGQLYDRAAAESSARLVRGRCTRSDGPTLARPEAATVASDAERGDPESPIPPPLPSDAFPAPPLRGPEPLEAASPTDSDALPARTPARDEDELELRARATSWAREGRPCEAIDLLRREGRSVRSRELAVALRASCRASRRGQ